MAKKKRRATKKAARKKEPARRKATASRASQTPAARKKTSRKKTATKKAIGKGGKKKTTPRKKAVGHITAEELAELPIEAAVVFAARCAMRVQPLVGIHFLGDLDREEVRKHLEAIDTAITIAASYRPAAYRADDITAYDAAASLARIASRSVDGDTPTFAARAAHYAALTARAACTTGDVNTAAAGTANRAAASFSSAYLAVDAASEDLAYLEFHSVAPLPKGRGFDPRGIFEHALWPGGEPRRWGAVLKAWSLGMNALGLSDIVDRYQRARRGEGFDLDAAHARIEAWYENVKATTETEPNIGAATGLRDQPSPKDHLGRKLLVDAFAGMFAAREQGTPFTLGLLGDWGAGKSSVMKQLENRLIEHAETDAGTLWKRFIALLRSELRPLRQWIARRRSSDDSSPRDPQLPRLKFHFADFNVWEYELTEDIRAGLAHEVVRGLTGDLNWWTRSRLKLNFAWTQHPWSVLWAIVLLLAIALWAAVGSVEPLVKNSTVVAAIVAYLLFLWKFIKPLLDHPLATKLQTYLKLPDYGKHLGAVPVMKDHIKTLCELRGVVGKDPTHRLIVFVDDLDRCGHEGIAEAFDAVRLVMNIPNVIVVIAVDHRIAFRAVARHYKDLADEDRHETEIARDYLGKIIHLPVELPEPTDMSDYIRNHLFSGADPIGVDALRAQPDQQTLGEKLEAFHAADEADSEALQEASEPANDIHGESVASIEQTKTTPKPTPLILMPATAEHCALFERWSKSFSFVNPRQLLRLRNTFRLLIQLNEAKAPEQRYSEQSMLVMLFWLEYLNTQRPDARVMSERALFNDGRNQPEVDKAVTAIGVRSVLKNRQRYHAMKNEIGRFVLPYGRAAAPTTDEHDGDGDQMPDPDLGADQQS